jgi:hypothetical protein
LLGHFLRQRDVEHENRAYSDRKTPSLCFHSTSCLGHPFKT